MRNILPILTIALLLLSGCAASATPATSVASTATTDSTDSTATTASTTSTAPVITATSTTAATHAATRSAYPPPDTLLPTSASYPAQGILQITPTEGYPAPQSTQSAASLAYPPDTTTGIAVVDQVIKAAVSTDHTALQEMVHFSTLPCTKREGLGGPPKCLPGEVEGTPVEVLPFLGSEGGHLRKSEVTPDSFKGSYSLLGAFKVKPPAHLDPDFPPGTYAVVFNVTGSDQSSGIVTLHLDDQGIVRIDSEGGVSDTILSQVESFLLPLKTQ